jgi:hypothetical protein
MRASSRLDWLRPSPLRGAQLQSKTRTSWQGYCQSLKRGARGAGRQIYIPNTREALTCWGYMQAMQDLSVLVDENGHRIMGACPPEQTTTLQLIRLFIRYARTHRTELPGNALVAVFRALRAAYPCRVRCICRLLAVRPEGANHQWRKNPPRELSIDLVADERLVRVTARAGAS